MQYFTHSFTTCQVLNVIASYEYQKKECVQQWNLFKCQTSTFYFSTYCPNLFEHLLIHASQTYERRDCCDRCISRWNNTSARSFFHPRHFLVHKQTSYTCHHILDASRSEWYLGKSLFAQRKWITECCSLRDAFSGSVTIFIVGRWHRWRHSDVIVIKLTDVIQNSITYKTYISDFSYFEN